MDLSHAREAAGKSTAVQIWRFYKVASFRAAGTGKITGNDNLRNERSV